MKKFSEICEQISATTKKLEKERILSEYLRQLGDEDLAIACVFLSGYTFSLRDQRKTHVGFAVVRDAILQIQPGAEEQLGALLIRTGDLGTAVAELLSGKLASDHLTLPDVMSYFAQLTAAGSNAQKRQMTIDVLNRAEPLEAKYILKILLGGMRIGLQESLVESSIAKAFKCPLVAVQRANMLLGDIGETAILAKYNRLAEAGMRLLHPLKLMLASPEEDVERILKYMDGCGVAEDKYDGIRAQIHKQEDQIKIYSRDLIEVTQAFPDIVQAINVFTGSLLMDGEIVPYKEGKILSFGELQTRLGRKVLSPEILQAVPCRYFAFDLLFQNGQLHLETPLQARRELLEGLQATSPDSFSLSIQTPVRTPEELEAAFEAARGRNNEGLVIKHPESTYTPGKRGKQWLKLKRALLTLDVVVTRAEYGHGKRAGLLSDYTFAVQQNGRYLTIGKAYSGITDEELMQLSDLFHRISLGNEGYYHNVPLQVVLEVTFDRINLSERHSSGFALRFPRIKRIRWDKTPEQIDTLETVQKLYETHFK
jgi:DNA ligase-1